MTRQKSPSKKRKAGSAKSRSKKTYPANTRPPHVEVKWIPSIKGWGVFAASPIRKGSVIERAPVIRLPEASYQKAAKTELENYAYSWPGGAVIVLGYGSLYNHSFEPNAEAVQDTKNRCLVYEAVRDIRKGEEIRVDYTGGGTEADIWFKPKAG